MVRNRGDEVFGSHIKKETRPRLSANVRRLQENQRTAYHRALRPLFHPDATPEPEQEVQPAPQAPDHEASNEWEDEPLNDHTEFTGEEAISEDLDASRRTAKYVAKRAQLQRNWDVVIDEMAPEFYLMKSRTKNWTEPAAMMDTCGLEHTTCECGRGKSRQIWLIDLLARTKQSLFSCTCTPDSVKLIRYGYIASSPIRPAHAFSIQTVQLYHELWKTTVLSTSGFAQGLSNFLEAREADPSTLRQQPPIISFRRTLAAAIQVYRRFLVWKTKTLDKIQNPSPEERLAVRCPACFGPSVDENFPTGQEPHVILALDGNFQQQHYKNNHQDSLDDSDYPDLFINPEKIQKASEYWAQNKGRINIPSSRCTTSHKAADDKRHAKTWNGCDDTGLFGCVCRHDAPLALATLFETGEKLYYPISILDELCTTVPEHRIGVLYDIGCNFESHIRKRKLLPTHVDRLTFGTSVFHAYAHEWPCQINYNPRFNPHWGLSDGEGTERLWAFLSPLVAPLRVSTRLHRLESISFRADYYNHILLSTLGKWFLRKLHRAKDAIRHADSTLSRLTNLVNPYAEGKTYDLSFFREQWKEERQAQLKNSSEEALKADLATAWDLQEKIKARWAEVEKSGLTLKQQSTKTKKINELQIQVSHLEANLGPDWLGVNALDDIEKKQLLRLWLSKRKLREKYLSMREEKKPLDDTRYPGQVSNLGTGRIKIFKSLKIHVDKLKKAVCKYNELRQAFHEAYPTRPCPDAIDYKTLIKLESDSPFWNDGLFTNPNEAWANDISTQQGMRAVAARDRGDEEIQRLGWEVRRCMRWSVDRAKSMASMMAVPENSTAMGKLNQGDRDEVAVHLVQDEAYALHALVTQWYDDLEFVFQETLQTCSDDEVLFEWKNLVKHGPLGMEGMSKSNISANRTAQQPLQDGITAADLEIVKEDCDSDEEEHMIEFLESFLLKQVIEREVFE